MTCDMGSPQKSARRHRAAVSDSADNSVPIALAAQAVHDEGQSRAERGAGARVRDATVSRALLVYIVASMFPDCLEIVIQGVTESGQPFRPSDWAERLCGMMSVFGEDRCLSYSPYLKPIIAAGVRCVV